MPGCGPQACFLDAPPASSRGPAQYTHKAFGPCLIGASNVARRRCSEWDKVCVRPREQRHPLVPPTSGVFKEFPI